MHISALTYCFLLMQALEILTGCYILVQVCIRNFC
ncbi:hypothetical protein BVRB_042950 [Beta vulgaris subsp. vulgaris]|uniref:Uncharacterized protein n=1 Tax=Beta vulgaris subsp. vulgaris TaxID=3555 RepID=A0A0J7YMB2_BETVV|nr:hypothetical protein BVRB_042950 [Beta vulgaris subsp. vulgaris]